MRIDPISFRRRSGSSSIWPTWKPRAFKDRGIAVNWSHISSLLIIFALFSHLRFILSGLCGFFSLSLFSVSPCETMTQGSMLRKDAVEKSLGAVVSRLRIKIPSFDNSELIKGYAKTMIGRCMNPRKQDMKGLLLMFPRICQVEGRVAGADLGLGRFQIDFDEEEDIVEVLKMEPFHFDGWMVSLVRWKPSVDPSYPSTLTFWVRVLGIPIEYWAYPTFKSIGDALGKVVDVDLDGGRVQVILDGFKPLCFETIIEFDSGETLVSLRYERLYGYCSYCFSLCHDVEHCEKKYGIRAPPTHALTGSDGAGTHNWSYKGAVAQDRQSQHGSEGKGKGIAIEKVREEERIEPSNSKATGFGKGKQPRFQGEGSSRNKRFTNYAQFNDHRFNEQKKLKAKAKEATKVKVVDSAEAQAVQVVQTEAFKPKKIVRKSLIFEDEAGDLSEQHSEIKEITNADNREAQAWPEAPKEKVSSQNDLDMGELSLDLSGVVTDTDLGRDQPEDAGFAVGDKESDLDEDNVFDSASLPSMEQVTSEAGEAVSERLEEEMRTVEEDDISVANLDQGAELLRSMIKAKGKRALWRRRKRAEVWSFLVLPRENV